MASYDSCLISTKSIGKLPNKEIYSVAAQYEKDGMNPQQAMIRSVLDRLELSRMDERSILAQVRAAYSKSGGISMRPDSVNEQTEAPTAQEETQEDQLPEEIAEPLREVSPLVRRLSDAGIVVLHDDVSTLPLEGDIPNGVQAMTSPDGTIHLVARSLGDNAAGVVLHEAFHSGGEKLVGTRKWNKLMLRLATLRDLALKSNGKLSQFYEDAADRVESAKSRGAVLPGMEAEEFGAYAIEEYAKAPASVKKWVDDFLGIVKDWLFRRFGVQLGEVTPAQLTAMAKLALLDARAYRFGENMMSTDRPETERGDSFSVSGSNVSGNSSFEIPEASRLDDMLRNYQDKFIDLKRVVDNIKKEIGTVEDKWDPYLQEELFHGRSTTGFKRFMNDELKPLIDDMRARKVTMEEFQEFLHMRHAQEANEQIASINPDMPDGGSGVKTQDALDYLAALTPAKRKAYDALAKRVDAINKQTRELMVAYGLESQDTVDAWDKAYEFYVPLKREDMDQGGGTGTGSGYSIRGSTTQRRMGSERNVVDILANIAMQREKVIVRGEKNRVAMALYGMAIKNPNLDFWRPINPQKNAAAVEAELRKQGLSQLEIGNIMEELKDRVIDPTTGLVTYRINPTLRNMDNVVSVRVNGIDRFIFFNKENDRAVEMAMAMKNLGIDKIEGFTSLMGMATRYFASINTQYNPIFGIVNLARDLSEGQINLTTTEIAGKQAQVVKEAGRLLGKIIVARGRLDNMKGADKALWEEFQQNGGTTGFREMFSSSADRAKELQKELSPDAWADGKWGKIFTAGGTLKVPYSVARKTGGAVFDWLSDYNEALENVTRMAAYKVAVDNGVSKQRAASLAKNLTVNFNRKGKVTSQIGAFYAFFNAAAQGTARMLKTLNGPAGKKIIAGGIGLGVMQAVLLAMAGFDDDEPPEFVKSRNLIIPLNPFSGKDNYVSIPLPLGFNFLPNTGRLFTEFLMGGGKKPGKYLGAWGGAVLDTFNPIGTSSTVLQTALPTVVDPLAALAENVDFTGKRIYQEDMSQLDPTPGYTRAKETSSAIGKGVAYYANLATGGTEYKPGAFSPTPDQVDYLIGQITGGVGREALKAQQSISSIFSGEELPSHKIPLAGRFYGNVQEKSAVASKYYDNLKEVNLHSKEVEGRQEDKTEYKSYLEEHPEAKLGSMASGMQREISQLRKRRRELLESSAPKADVEKIEELIRDRMDKFNQEVKKQKDKAAK
jgi:hypothetical protein